MNALFINYTEDSFTPTRSGAIATHIWECCREAQGEGFQPIVISARCDAEPYQDVDAILLDYPRISKNPLARRIFRAQRRLTGWRHLRQKKYAARIARSIRDGRLHDRPMILHNDPELAVYLREIFPRAFIVHHFHNQIQSASTFARRLPEAANVITAVSDFTSRWVENTYKLKTGTVRTIYNGVDNKHFSPRNGRHDCLPVINFVGRTGIEKAPDLLLKAAVKLARKNSAFSVQIVGSNHWDRFEQDSYQSELQMLAGELERMGVAVRRPGHVPRLALPGELRQADINVVPSRWDEPFALTIVEGMACGLATVVSRTGGAPEVVGDAGFLFERNSVDDLAGHLDRLLSDQPLRDEYARRARARAEQFTWSQTWTQFRAAAAA